MKIDSVSGEKGIALFIKSTPNEMKYKDEFLLIMVNNREICLNLPLEVSEKIRDLLYETFDQKFGKI